MLSDGSDGEWGEKRRALVRHSGEWRSPSADGSGELQFPSDPLRRGVESRDARLGGSFRNSDALEFFFIWSSVDRKVQLCPEYVRLFFGVLPDCNDLATGSWGVS